MTVDWLLLWTLLVDGANATQLLRCHCFHRHKSARCRCCGENLIVVSGWMELLAEIFFCFLSFVSPGWRKFFYFFVSSESGLLWLISLKKCFVSFVRFPFHPKPFLSFILINCFEFCSPTAEANERAGAGEGHSAGRSGGGGAGQRLVPGPNPQCHWEAAADWSQLPLHGELRATTFRSTVVILWVNYLWKDRECFKWYDVWLQISFIRLFLLFTYCLCFSCACFIWSSRLTAVTWFSGTLSCDSIL